MSDNPYPNASNTMNYELHTAWDEGYAEGFAAGRAAASPDPPTIGPPPSIGLVTVRYHGEGGSWWADSDDLTGWTATSDTLDSLRAKAREGVFMVTGKYPSLVHGMTTGNEGYDTFDLLAPLAAASPDPPAEPWSCCGQTFTGTADFISGARSAHVCDIAPEDVPDAETAYAMGKAAATPPAEGSVSYRVRDRDSDYKAMCHEDRDHAELLLKAWLADGRDAVVERRHVFDGGWLPVGPPFFTEQQERALARCEGYDEARAASPDERLREALALVYVMLTGAEPMWAEMPLDERCARAANEAQQAFLAADREATDEETHDGDR